MEFVLYGRWNKNGTMESEQEIQNESFGFLM